MCDCIHIDQLMNEQKTSKSKSAEAVQAQRKYIWSIIPQLPCTLLVLYKYYIARHFHWINFSWFDQFLDTEFSSSHSVDVCVESCELRNILYMV